MKLFTATTKRLSKKTIGIKSLKTDAQRDKFFGELSYYGVVGNLNGNRVEFFGDLPMSSIREMLQLCLPKSSRKPSLF